MLVNSVNMALLFCLWHLERRCWQLNKNSTNIIRPCLHFQFLMINYVVSQIFIFSCIILIKFWCLLGFVHVRFCMK